MSWNFQYWNPSKYHSQMHHAQSTFLTLVRMKYLKQHKFLIINDLDEFIRPVNCSSSLIEFLNAQELETKYWIVYQIDGVKYREKLIRG